MKSVFFILCCLLAIARGQKIEKDAFFKPRVVNGEDVKLSERPFQISLHEFGWHSCGGSIINEHWVVTAAHCVDGPPSSYQIIAGTIDIQEPYSLHEVDEIVIHGKYTSNSDSSRNDISLIKVVIPFKFSYRVQPVALPKLHYKVKTNSTAVLSGWRRLLDISWSHPRKLQKVSIYIADQEYCGKVMKEININIYQTDICAYDPSIRKRQCSGDSGSSLTVDGVLTGIVAWSIRDPNCGSTKFPGVYTRVSEFVDWIYEHTK